MLTQPRYGIPVPDLAHSADCFREVLDFSVNDMGDPGWRWSERGACVVTAGECPDAFTPADLGGHSDFGCVEVSDVDALRTKLAARRTECFKPLRSEPWGMREFASA